ncbi:divergent PAP2 family protein [Cellulosilyticum sp. ST5]|uniref:Acid phosphatase/vanadium-dependent haloperoxidase related protein n=1 Tax=Cellulosilyticum lentocellum (strain ATCC 49066 / DSM 5427 / NCIMB 11756 / RHM5) TaxID=642492 RepID=F2JMF4_CELLD|nr:MULTISPECIES: divergent PAP2 family protein [Cellulosilyticum]ADZ83472.1 acid phosphatase/vanadium-dependent haloperoxidase related protein [Cellulosilyticum lentocellum DSM 5427]QEH68923.1 divergent PAP2 family protein [Cellulosilyticum sp. WCF-2]
MNPIEQLLQNKILWVAIVSWFIAQLFKVIITLLQEHRLDWSKLWASGGMPSSHSAFVMSLAISAGQVWGYDSTYFAIAAVVSFVVMYDAANVRLEAGKQAAVINQIIEVLENPDLNPEERLKEILGHTPLQVVAGGVLGFVIAILSFM